jgi:hypothetical protein
MHEDKSKKQTGQDLPLDLIVTVGIVSALFLFIVIVVTQAWFYSWTDAEYDRKFVQPPYAELVNQTADQLERLNSFGWTNKDAQEVRIPIDLAITKYVETYDQADVDNR